MEWWEILITLVIGFGLGASIVVLLVVAAWVEFWKELLNK